MIVSYPKSMTGISWLGFRLIFSTVHNFIKLALPELYNNAANKRTHWKGKKDFNLCLYHMWN